MKNSLFNQFKGKEVSISEMKKVKGGVTSEWLDNCNDVAFDYCSNDVCVPPSFGGWYEEGNCMSECMHNEVDACEANCPGGV